MKKNSNLKVAVITGASRGIGRAIALKLDQESFTTILVSRSKQNLFSALKGFSKKAIAIQADVSREDEVVSMVRKVIKKFGRLDILVNNVGLYASKPIENINNIDFESMVNVNLGSVLYCCREATLQMKKQPAGGQIINISSIAAKIPDRLPQRSLYCMVKAGMGALAESLQAELKNNRVKIATIYAGLVYNEFITELKSREPEALKRDALKVEDIAHIAWMIVNQGKNSNISEVIVQQLVNVPMIKKSNFFTNG